MSKQIASNVSYPVAPGTTVLLSIDCQFGFGAGSWEQVPHADVAVENFRQASRAWRECIQRLCPAAGLACSHDGRSGGGGGRRPGGPDL